MNKIKVIAHGTAVEITAEEEYESIQDCFDYLIAPALEGLTFSVDTIIAGMEHFIEEHKTD